VFGYFFPIRPLSSTKDWTLAIATDISWAFGAPGLVVTKGADTFKVQDVGLFIGSVEGDRTYLDLA
jgi:hypothetical protein